MFRGLLRISLVIAGVMHSGCNSHTFRNQGTLSAKDTASGVMLLEKSYGVNGAFFQYLDERMRLRDSTLNVTHIRDFLIGNGIEFAETGIVTYDPVNSELYMRNSESEHEKLRQLVEEFSQLNSISD